MSPERRAARIIDVSVRSSRTSIVPGATDPASGEPTIAKATKESAADGQRFRIPFLQRNGGVRETTATEERHRPPEHDVQEDSLPDTRLATAVSNPPQGDWDRQQPTEAQARYIDQLGGDPSSVATKREASDRIDSLFRTKSAVWPLHPDLLRRRAEEAGIQSGGEWRSAHHSLLARLRLDLQQYVDLSLNNLRTKLSDPFGPAGSRQSQGPGELVRKAREDLKRLELYRKYRKPLVSQVVSETDSDILSPDSDSGELFTKLPADRDMIDNSRTHWTQWLWLFFVFAACVVVEALANISLLMDALPGGALAAYFLAVLVSIVNVGGFGIGVGMLLSWLNSRIGQTNRQLFLAACSLWIVSATAFNLVAGRHREAYARVVERIREAPTDTIPPAREFLADVSINPLTWEFQALLFTLLGIFLCVVGFVKGFTFIQRPTTSTTEDSNHVDDFSLGDPPDAVKTDPHIDPNIFARFTSLPERYCGTLTDDLRSDVANWYRSLDHERRNIITLLKALEEEQNRQACIDHIEHSFIVFHNNNYPDKIDLNIVRENRCEKHPDPLVVTASDPQVLDEAGQLVTEWGRSGQAAFDERISTAHKEIADLWDDYKALVLGKPEKLTGGSGAVSWTTRE